MHRKKVIIIGSGFAGLNAAHALKRAHMDLTLIERTNHHLFQPLLYQVATAALSPSDIATPIRKIFAKQSNLQILMDSVVTIDKEKSAITLQSGRELSFDVLIIAIGARHSYFGKEEWAEHAPGLKTLEDAALLRNKILFAFEQAERALDPKEALHWLHFAVVGGGPTGIEMAGAIAELVHHNVKREFRKIDPSNVKVVLIEAAPQLLPGMPLELAQRAKKDLEALGVEVRTGAMVTEIDREGISFGKERLRAHTVIWAAGNEVSPLLKQLDVPTDRQGWVIVTPNLSLPGSERIFVLGDAAHCKGPDGNPLPAIAPVAIQQGRYLAKRLLSTKPSFPFMYFDRGLMATIGRFKAIGAIGPLTFAGFPAWLAWSAIHLLYLVNHRNRFIVAMQWLWWLFSKERGGRIIGPEKDRESSF